MSKLFYRVANIKTKQGLWYDSNGEFTGLIHNEFNFCQNKDLRMPFDMDLVGWLSATDSLEDLFNWFPKKDIEKLEQHGWYITVYEADDFKEYKNHLVISQETSKVKEFIHIKDCKLHTKEDMIDFAKWCYPRINVSDKVDDQYFNNMLNLWEERK